jgi:hypothetical protein
VEALSAVEQRSSGSKKILDRMNLKKALEAKAVQLSSCLVAFMCAEFLLCLMLCEVDSCPKRDGWVDAKKLMKSF